MDGKEILAKNIRRLRVAADISQEALAYEAGIDRTYMSRLERAQENPTLAIMQRLADALDARLRDLLDHSTVTKAPVAPLKGGRRSTKAKRRL
jgi:transcriptional regulator with XRE-family HTH domain